MGCSRFFQIADFCVARPRVSQLGEKEKGRSLTYRMLTDWFRVVCQVQVVPLGVYGTVVQSAMAADGRAEERLFQWVALASV